MKTLIPLTIDDLEETAKQESDGGAGLRIRGEWLEVEYMLDETFRYLWGKNIVSRDVVINVLASK